MKPHLRPVTGQVRLRIHWQEVCEYITVVTLTVEEAAEIEAADLLQDPVALRDYLDGDDHQHLWFEAADTEKDFVGAEDRHVLEVKVLQSMRQAGRRRKATPRREAPR